VLEAFFIVTTDDDCFNLSLAIAVPYKTGDENALIPLIPNTSCSSLVSLKREPTFLLNILNEKNSVLFV
jgi:hypothetical protein